ncbi:MAG: hypothetical protein V1778_04960 [bacterium]
MPCSAVQSYRTYLGRIGEAYVEYLLLRSGYDVLRAGQEVMSENALVSAVSVRDKLRPDFRIRKKKRIFLVEVTYSPTGKIPEGKWERIDRQVAEWPETIVIYVDGNDPDPGNQDPYHFNPFFILQKNGGSDDSDTFVTLNADEPPLFITKRALRAAMRLWFK